MLFSWLFEWAIWLLFPFIVIGGSLWVWWWRNGIWSTHREQVLLRRQSQDKNNPKWPAWTEFLYECRTYRLSGKEREDMAERALNHYERWLSLETIANDYSRLPALIRMAFEANKPEKAHRYAKQLLNLAKKAPNAPPWGNALHHGHTALGRLALQAGNIQSAKEYLLRAGETPGSPQLDSYGPNTVLASELLQAGERDAVLEYFALCSRFWKMGDKKLARWSAQIRLGENPDFGRNKTR